MKKIVLTLIVLIGMVSCKMYKDASSLPFLVNDVKIGTDKSDILKRYGQPFSFDIRTDLTDTITVLCYKEPKRIANSEFIITTKLTFNRNKLKKITQENLLVPENIIICDTTNNPLNQYKK